MSYYYLDYRMNNHKFIRWLPHFVLAFSILVTSALTIKNPIAFDSYLHFGIGKHMFADKKIILHGDISFKSVQPSLEWVNHSWAGDLFLYWVSLKGNMFVVVLVLMPIVAICAFLSFRQLKLVGVGSNTALLMVSTAVLIFNVFLKLHPLVFALPLMMLVFYLYLLYRNGSYKVVFLIPVIYLIIANVSGGFLFVYFGFLLILLIFEFILWIFGRGQSSFGHGRVVYFFIATIISFLVSLLNPYGFRLYLYSISLTAVTQGKSAFSTLPGVLAVVNQNFVKNPYSSVFLTIFVVYVLILFCFLVYVFARYREEFLKKVLFLLPLLYFLVPAYVWIRFIPLATFLTLPIFGVLVSVITHAISAKLRRIIYLGFSVCFVLLLFYLLLFKLQETTLVEPKIQTNLIKEFNLNENIYSSFDITGYALLNLFPRRGAIDAQDDIFDETQALGFYVISSAVSKDSLDDVVGKNNIKTAIIARESTELATGFGDNQDWSLVYFDKAGFLFVKKSDVDSKFIEENTLKHIKLSRNLGFDPLEINEAQSELEAFTSRYPANSLALGQLATIYRVNKNLDKAVETLLKIPKSEWTFVTYTEMGRIKASSGDCRGAEESYLSALERRREKNYSRTVLDIGVLYALCFRDLEKAKHYFQRYKSFQLSPDEKEKLRKISDEFGIKLED